MQSAAGRTSRLECAVHSNARGHWVVADLLGKAGHIRTIPIPTWVKDAIDQWISASGITEGCLLHAINKAGKIGGSGVTPKVLWEVVQKAAKIAEIEKLAPHDLRRNVRSALSFGRQRA